MKSFCTLKLIELKVRRTIFLWLSDGLTLGLTILFLVNLTVALVVLTILLVVGQNITKRNGRFDKKKG